MYKEIKQLNLLEIDKEILGFWEKNDIFQKSINQRDPKNSFVFYEGPPSANGMPGIHHVMARAIKDIFCRFQTLKGKRVERKGGWDTHGLPIELSVEKELGITKEDIGKKISVDDYNKACRETVLRYKDRWDDLTRQMGYWVDLENPYITYENEYIESVWSLLKRLYDKELIYKGYTIQPYSPAAGTGLSSHELNQPGCYKDVRDTSAVAQFKAVRNESSEFLFRETQNEVYFLAWTTTPWTLPSNCALAVGHNIPYLLVNTFNPYTSLPVAVILAKDLLHKYFPEKNAELRLEDYKEGDKAIPYKVLTEFAGHHLKGLKYEQLLPYVQPSGKAFEVIMGDFVTTSDGTGIVHTASLFGADDFRVCTENGIASVLVKDENGNDTPLVNKQGRFVAEVTDFALEYVKEDYYTETEKETERQKQGGQKYLSVDERISIKLKKENKAFKVERYEHSYPHCWRTDKPVLYYPLDSWFIRATAVKERMVQLNKSINWKPESTGTGRFGQWLENLNDWNLSRSRYWGIPLPIWRTEDTTEEIIIGSIEELETAIAKANEVLGKNQAVPKDLHRPYIDDVILVSASGKPMTRELDLIDVWFDSGAMPYAQWGYPKNTQSLEGRFPADFIAEGVDQTRGWFYTLHAIAVMCFDSVAYKNVVSNGLVLDKNGQKMSKRLGNAVDPFETIGTYGADATRWYMISNSQPWDNLKFNIDGISETTRKFFGTLFNTYNFFAMYANVDGYKRDLKNDVDLKNRPEIDKWIISKLNSLVKEVGHCYETYEPTQAARAIEKFTDEHLSNWYVRLCRRRFWRGEMNEDKKAAYDTLHHCLLVITQLSSPIAPFFSDWLYQQLGSSLGQSSVHLTDWMKVQEKQIDVPLEQRMDYAQRISSLILSIRKKEKIRVRQPLTRALLPILDASFEAQVEAVKDLILAETNVKNFEYITDTSGVVKKKIRPNLKSLGKLLGGNMKLAMPIIEAMTQDDINAIERTKQYEMLLNGEKYELTADDFLITSEDIPGWQVATDNDLAVALDINLTPELRAEGTARDLVNRIQNIRKEQNFNITDRIHITLQNHESITDAVTQFGDYIKGETLADSLILSENIIGGVALELEGDLVLKAEVKRV